MNFTVVPKSDSLGKIEANTLKDAIGMKHCLLAKMDIRSTIQDSDGFVVSEKEQSEYIWSVFC